MEMMAMRLYGPKDMRYESVPIPELGAGDVRVRVAFCGICGTDVEIYSGASSFWADGLIRTPMTLGHECSGIVDGVGEEVTKAKVGDKVVLDPVVSCGSCEACVSGRKQECEKIKCLGTIKSIDGGFAEYVVVPERGIHLLPDNVSLIDGALIEPLSIALYAVERAGIQIGDTVLIAGTGAIGLGAIPFARFKGAKKIVVLGRKKHKLEVAEKLGADLSINIEGDSERDVLKELNEGKGANCLFEMTGSEKILLDILGYAAYGARISIPSFYAAPVANFPIDDLVMKNATAHFVFSNADTYPRVIKMLESGKLDISMLVTHFYPLRDAVKSLLDLEHGDEGRVKHMLEMERNQ